MTRKGPKKRDLAEAQEVARKVHKTREAGISSTTVGGGDSDLRRAQRLNKDQDPKQDNVLQAVVNCIEEQGQRMELTGGIPKLAMEICSDFLNVRAVQGFKRLGLPKDAIATACLKAACDEQGVHRTIAELSNPEICNCDGKSLRSAISLVRKTVPRHVEQVEPSQLTARFCSYLRLFGKERKANAVLKTAPDALLQHHTAPTMAAAAIAKGCEVDPAKVSEASGVALSTIVTVLRRWEQLTDVKANRRCSSLTASSSQAARNEATATATSSEPQQRKDDEGTETQQQEAHPQAQEPQERDQAVGGGSTGGAGAATEEESESLSVLEARELPWRLRSSGSFGRLASSGSAMGLARGASGLLGSIGSSRSQSSARQLSGGSPRKLSVGGSARQLSASGSAKRLSSSGSARRLSASGSARRLSSSGSARRLSASGSARQLSVGGSGSSERLLLRSGSSLRRMCSTGREASDVLLGVTELHTTLFGSVEGRSLADASADLDESALLASIGSEEGKAAPATPTTRARK